MWPHVVIILVVLILYVFFCVKADTWWERHLAKKTKGRP
jgi:hypothetical protein